MAEVEVTIGASSQIDTAFYDAEAQKLRMLFFAGEYLYSGVDQGTVDGLSSAGSPGTFWNQNKGRFAYVRVG